jgi:uncharacterized membrane protein
MIAAIRPDSWNPVLYLHVAGAMALVATLVVAAYAIANAARRGDHPSVRFAFRTLWMAVLPSLIVMRVGAQLILSKEHLENSNDAWIGIGFSAGDGGVVLLLAAIVVTGLATRRAAGGADVSRAGLLRAGLILAGIMILANVVAIYAMTAKPS